MKKFFDKLLKNCDLFKGKANGFTLAEVLITLGIIGIVAAVTVPTLMKNYQQKVQNEKVRMVKYKLTQATSVMNTDGLIKSYPTTQDFVNQLQKYLKISKVCDSNHLTDCWPTTTITVPTTSGTTTTTNVSSIKKGSDLKALGVGTKNTDTMGIVLADGTPMILTYSPKCNALEQYKSYKYSIQDGKPVTNATTNCISAIFDINGKAKPNRIGLDVRTLNSLFGFQKITSYRRATDAECDALKRQGLIEACYYENYTLSGAKYPSNEDDYAGAIKVCSDLKLYLPDTQTLKVIAGSLYGISDFDNEDTYYNTSNEFDENSALNGFDGGRFFSTTGLTSKEVYIFEIDSRRATWYTKYRNRGYDPLCVAD